ncbi:MAG: methylated-DNA--[protein]-cysteine S-methyltransferase [Rubrobacter sp.]
MNRVLEGQAIAAIRTAGRHLSGDERDHERSAKRILAGGVDHFFTVTSPLGEVYVGVGEGGVRLLAPRIEEDSEFVRRYGEEVGRLVVPDDEGRLDGLRRKVEAAFAGERVEVPVDLTGRTEFQRRVMEVVLGIPRGQVRPYNWVAAETGNPRASRAVGTVMAKNPIPLIVPCHRVIRNDGATGNYGYDPEEKVRLLKGEGVPVDEVARSPYIATPTTGIVCHATCQHARRIKPENSRGFRSVARAMDAGFRPCKVCRPVAAA